MLVHLKANAILDAYCFVDATIPESLIQHVEERDLPNNWQSSPPPLELQQIGNLWIQNQRSAVLRVPSAVISGEYNYLLNPQHADFHQIQFGNVQPFRFDERLKS